MTDDRFWDGIWWVVDGDGPGFRSATLVECWAEIMRLRQALYDVAAMHPAWNGGIAPHRPRYLYDFIDELKEVAREALKPAETLPKGSE